MSGSALGPMLGIVLPALLAGMLVSLALVPLGLQVLSRGIVFIDLAVAQIAGLGVICADALGLEPQGWAVQASALGAAVAGACFLTWTERRWPEVQEAIIGVSFVLSASVALMVLAHNPHGGEQLKDLLSGQILWVDPHQLMWEAPLYALVAWLWQQYGPRLGRLAFYLLFALAVTLAVQQVGVYLVFATLIVPALATSGTRAAQWVRLSQAYTVACTGYLTGLGLSAWLDLPSGATVVCALVLCAVLWGLAASRLRGA